MSRGLWGEGIRIGTPQERIDDFVHDGSPPDNKPLQVLCEDHNGTYVLPFLCQWRDGIWQHAKTNRRIEAAVCKKDLPAVGHRVDWGMLVNNRNRAQAILF